MPPAVDRLGLEPVLVTPRVGEPISFSRTPPEVALYIETARESGRFAIAPDVIDWATIERRIDGADNKATLQVEALDITKMSRAGDLGTEHLTHLLSKLHGDLRVRIGVTKGQDGPAILFQGFPVSRQPRWTPQGQGLTCSAILEAQEILRSHEKALLGGQMRRLNPLRPQEPGESDLVEVAALPVVFNPNGKPNRAKHSISIDDEDGFRWGTFGFVDAGSKDAEYWNFADALRYVVLHNIHLPAIGVSAFDFLWDTQDFVDASPAADSTDPLVRRITARVNNVSVQSMHAEDALIALCAAGHLHFVYEISTEASSDPSLVEPTYGLRIFAVHEREGDGPSSAQGDVRRLRNRPVVLDIKRDKPFSDYTGLTAADIANRNEARISTLNLDARVVTRPVFLGGAREFQVTVLLRPGWLPHANVDNVVGQAAINTAIDFWADAFGRDESAGELERDPATGAFLRWHSKYHPQHPDFRTVAAVWRLWVFPDDLTYLNTDLLSSPFARTSGPWRDWNFWNPFLNVEGPQVLVYADYGLGGSIPADEVAHWMPRPRPFADTIARLDLASTSRAPILWMHFQLAGVDPRDALFIPGWVRYPGTPKIDKQRAAIRLDDENLWAATALREDPHDEDSNMIVAYLEGRFFLALTATVRGDTRLRSARTPSSSLTRPRAATVDLGFERFRYRKIIHDQATFPMATGETDPQYQDRDDTQRLEQFAEHHAAVGAKENVAGNWVAPYIKTEVRLGDSFSGCSGMGIEFESFPEVVAIEYTKDKDAGFATTYHLSDLRHAPEVGSE